jgi:hypothetical protein
MRMKDIQIDALLALNQFYSLRHDMSADSGEDMGEQWRLHNADLILSHFLPDIWDAEGHYKESDYLAIYKAMLLLA